MIKIDGKSREVKIILNKFFYPEDLIFIAAKNFKDICDIKINNQEIILRPKSDDIQLDKIGYEFCNYVLSLVANSIK